MATKLKSASIFLLQLLLMLAVFFMVLKFSGVKLSANQQTVFSVLLGGLAPVSNALTRKAGIGLNLLKLSLATIVLACVVSGLFVLMVKLGWLNF